jgi:hypothetical protein
MSKNTAGFVILGIISIAGLGLGGYTYYMTLVSPQIVEKQGLILVGLWDELDYNTDFTPYITTYNWLLEYRENRINNSDYFSVSNNNTRITLLKPGWYRIHLSMELWSIDANQTYLIIILKNGVQEFYLLYHKASATPEPAYVSFDSSAFLYSNGTDYFEIRGYGFGDPFFVGGQIYNQLTIEFVL